LLCNKKLKLKFIMSGISENFRRIRSEIPGYVEIVPASKTRTSGEIRELIDAGCTNIGENYVREAQEKHRELGGDAFKLRWHLIGHLQRNKVKSALEVFDVIQAVDSVKLAEEINKRAEKPVTVYVEVNSGGEETKSGVSPDEIKNLISDISGMENLRVEGLMTIEPYSGNPEESRVYFREMKRLFDETRNLKIPNAELKTLSMGMSSSYREAVEEGSNMVRIGTKIFGER